MKKIVALVLSVVMVMGLATVAFADTTAPIYDLWLADITAAAAEAEGTAYTTTAAVKNENGSGVLEYITIGTASYVKIDAADATTLDYYVTKENDKTPLFYLKKLTSTDDVAYDFTVVEFTNIGVKCGQLNAAYEDYTTNEIEFYLHTDAVTGVKTYYASEAITAVAPYYAGVSTATSATNVLVAGEVVEAYKFTTNPLNAHVWAPSGYDKTTPVTAVCGICGAKGNLYEADEIPAKSVVDAVLTIGTTDYSVVVTSAAGSTAGTTTETVESAKTFDAGIAMYVGMSVMAAAGSAVVLKKKD